MSTATVGLALRIVVATFAYGATVLSVDPPAATIWQHLAFRTGKVEAIVDRSSENGTCTGTGTGTGRPGSR